MRRLGWVAMAAVVAVALFVGSRDDGGPRTAAQRVQHIASEVRCPTCRGLSAAESDAKAAQAIRDEIRTRVNDGETDKEIRAFLVSRYGRDILLRPEATGVPGLVWVLPVVAVLCAIAGLSFSLLRDSTSYSGPDRAKARSGKARAVVAGAAVVAVATAAGVAMARSSGERIAGDQATGSLPAGSIDRITRAQALVADGKALEAVKLYDEILREDPEHPVALTQRGWLISRAGLVDEGLASIDRAIAADPTYPDAHFFRGFILWRDKGDPAAAAEEFAIVLRNRPPPDLAKAAEEAHRQTSAEAAA